MALHDVPINDVHTYVMRQFKQDEKHPAHTQYLKVLQGKSPLHKPVVGIIRELLG